MLEFLDEDLMNLADDSLEALLFLLLCMLSYLS